MPRWFISCICCTNFFDTRPIATGDARRGTSPESPHSVLTNVHCVSVGSNIGKKVIRSASSPTPHSYLSSSGDLTGGFGPTGVISPGPMCPWDIEVCIPLPKVSSCLSFCEFCGFLKEVVGMTGEFRIHF